MRSEKTLYDLILSFARHNDAIRAVWMNGSRANPNAPKGILQDFDIVYAVTDIGPFRKNPGWIARFGKPLMVLEPDSQMPDAASARPDEKYTWLMLFEDGNRIDLTRGAWTPPPDMPPASDVDYHVARPAPDAFRQCCESFWWDATYVAKGLWRREILYAMDHLNLIVRPSLIDMLTWTAGLATGFSVSTGKNGKYLDRYLPAPCGNGSWPPIRWPNPNPSGIPSTPPADSSTTLPSTSPPNWAISYNRQQAIAIGLYISKIRGNRLDR